jgi:predicted ATP-grasp superfamily ATP-dependent carboligase
MKVLVHEWVTGGGLAGRQIPPGWQAEGRAIRQALAAEFRRLDGVDVIVTLDERFGRDESDPNPVLVAPGREEETLHRLSRECDYTVLIAPETGGVLSARLDLVERAGGRSLGSTPRAVAVVADKHRLARHLASHGIPTPPTQRLPDHSGPPPGTTYPAVIKPLDGAGALHTYRLEGPGDVPPRSSLPRDMILQPVSPGDAMSATFLLDGRGSVRLVGVAWQDIETSGGLIRYRGGRVPAPTSLAVGAPLSAVVSLPGLRGLVGVDFVHNARTGATTVIEINPRPTTSIVGFLGLLPPGTLARAWLDTVRASEPIRELRGMISPEVTRTVRFRHDGTVLEE